MSQGRYVSEEKCKELRRLGNQGLTSRQIAERTDWSRTTADHHAFGHCNHDHSLDPVDNERLNVSEEKCAELRQQVKEEQSVKAVAEHSEFSNHTINRHTRGRCHHTDVDHDPVKLRKNYDDEIKYQIHRLYHEENKPTNEIMNWLEEHYGVDIREGYIKDFLFGSR